MVVAVWDPSCFRDEVSSRDIEHLGVVLSVLGFNFAVLSAGEQDVGDLWMPVEVHCFAKMRLVER